MERFLNGRGLFTALVVLGATVLAGCSDLDEGPLAPGGPDALLSDRAAPRGVEEAIAAQERHTEALMAIPGVIGTAVGLMADGGAAVRVFVTGPERPRVPDALDGVPVELRHTGMFMARSDQTTKARPAPLGFSVGHPDITAGSIGARVVDALGNVYVLSNNHVLAASNAASIGDPILQPGVFDGGTLADQLATLEDYYFIDFTFSGYNTMDAAIALSTTADLGNATPTDDAYGPPSSEIFGDADGDGAFDNVAALLGLQVKKYGRTTGLTQGQITDVNAFVEVCYAVLFGICITSGYFFDQLIIEPGSFSDGGDSGSLIVTADALSSPVALLFAGSATQTIGNRIDLVLSYFDVTIDGGPATPPTPITDVAITGVAAPASATEGAIVEVVVSVENTGNQDVAGPFDVSLTDATDAAPVGAQTVGGLASGATADLTFQWNTSGASEGGHILLAAHDLPDDDVGNDTATASVAILPAGTPTTVHVGDLDGSVQSQGGSWTASVAVLIHDAAHLPVAGATVSGFWATGGEAGSCVTAGAGGSCTVSLPGIPKRTKEVAFTVTAVTLPDGRTYAAPDNHDPDGDSGGTSITVAR